MAIEIERKFLVKRIPKDKIEYSDYIKQGYIVSDKYKKKHAQRLETYCMWMNSHHIQI